jgi:hypothetical protein
MPNAAAAEWLIARFTDRSRASSIVGDLLEVTPQQESPLFWLSVAGVVLSLTWRHLAGFAAALSCMYLLDALTMPPIPNLFLAHRPPDTWIPFLFLLAVIVEALWMAAPYALIRYGVRDRFTQLTLALCVPFTLILVFWFMPTMLFASFGIVAVILLAFMLFAQGRKAILTLTIATVFGYVGLQTTIYLSERYLELAAPSVTRTVVVRGSLPFWVALIFTMACSWAHHFLLQRDQNHPKIEPAA